MAIPNSMPLLAVDVGNSRIKLGEFEHPFAEPLPQPARFAVLPLDWAPRDLTESLARDPGQYAWSISSVNRPAAARIFELLSEHKVAHVQQLTYTDLPLVIDLPRPDLVGLDRLANAVAANRLRAKDQPAIVIDLGTAMKVDVISATGAFAGGAILPGLAMAARALHEFTDLLPLVEVVVPPATLGTSTLDAIRSGLYWGAVGAVRELVGRLAEEGRAVQFFLTGGDSPNFAAILGTQEGRSLHYVPHLTLSGIALSALRAAPSRGSG